jgi:hypothetical protein
MESAAGALAALSLSKALKAPADGDGAAEAAEAAEGGGDPPPQDPLVFTCELYTDRGYSIPIGLVFGRPFEHAGRGEMVVAVGEVTAGSPAERWSGWSAASDGTKKEMLKIRRGDVLLSVNGLALRDHLKGEAHVQAAYGVDAVLRPSRGAQSVALTSDGDASGGDGLVMSVDELLRVSHDNAGELELLFLREAAIAAGGAGGAGGVGATSGSPSRVTRPTTSGKNGSNSGSKNGGKNGVSGLATRKSLDFPVKSIVAPGFTHEDDRHRLWLSSDTLHLTGLGDEDVAARVLGPLDVVRTATHPEDGRKCL